MERVELLPPQGKLPELLAREAKRGNSYGLKPFVYLHATWCGPCRALSASLAHPLMVEAFRGTYIIELDLDAWKDQLPSVGIKADGGFTCRSACY